MRVLAVVRELITDLAERRKPSGVAKPEGLRPAATFGSGNLFPDESLVQRFLLGA